MNKSKSLKRNIITRSILDNTTDDFEEENLQFRFPKKSKIESYTEKNKKRGRPKKNEHLTRKLQSPRFSSQRGESSRSIYISSRKRCDSSNQSGIYSRTDSSTSDLTDNHLTSSNDKDVIVEYEKCDVKEFNESLVNSNNEIYQSDNEFLNLEKSICSDSEKLCPSCKHIVNSDIFTNHFTDCLKKFTFSSNINKAKEKEDILSCPICLKSFSCSKQRPQHIKTCGQNHGMTLEQILLASRLQEKQRDERLSLGLPLGPKSSAGNESKIKKASGQKIKDPDLDLAVALSCSLAEQEKCQREEEEEQLLDLGLPNLIQEHRRTNQLVLPQPDIAIHQPGKSSSGRRKKNALNLRTTLVTRTHDDRQRILSEKVAEILASEQSPKLLVPEKRHKFVLSSRSLKHLQNRDCPLWNFSYSNLECPTENHYVPELEDFIKVQNMNVGGLFKHFSQVPGRLNYTVAAEDNDDEKEIDGDENETSVVDDYCTQLALAELVASQDTLNFSLYENNAISQRNMELNTERNMELNTERNMELKTKRNMELNTEEEKHKLIKDSDENGKNNIEEFVKITKENKDTAAVCEENKDTAAVCEENKDTAAVCEEYKDPATVCEENKDPAIVCEENKDAVTKDSSDSAIEQINSKRFQDENKDICLTLLDCSQDGWELCDVKGDINNTTQTISVNNDSCVQKRLCGKEELNCEEDNKKGFKDTDVKLYSKSRSSTKINTKLVPSKMTYKLFHDWGSLLESGNWSDVTIHTANGEIPTHSLVLNVRCPIILEKFTSSINGSPLSVDWNCNTYEAACKFLFYLYTGSCDIRCKSDPDWLEVFDLAIKYHCEDLSAYLQSIYQYSALNNSLINDNDQLCEDKENVDENLPVKCNTIEKILDFAENEIDHLGNIKPNENDHIENRVSFDNEKVRGITLFENAQISNVASPDIFEDSTVMDNEIPICPKEANEHQDHFKNSSLRSFSASRRLFTSGSQIDDKVNISQKSNFSKDTNVNISHSSPNESDDLKSVKRTSFLITSPSAEGKSVKSTSSLITSPSAEGKSVKSTSFLNLSPSAEGKVVKINCEQIVDLTTSSSNDSDSYQCTKKSEDFSDKSEFNKLEETSQKIIPYGEKNVNTSVDSDEMKEVSIISTPEGESSYQSEKENLTPKDVTVVTPGIKDVTVVPPGIKEVSTSPIGNNDVTIFSNNLRSELNFNNVKANILVPIAPLREVGATSPKINDVSKENSLFKSPLTTSRMLEQSLIVNDIWDDFDEGGMMDFGLNSISLMSPLKQNRCTPPLEHHSATTSIKQVSAISPCKNKAITPLKQNRCTPPLEHHSATTSIKQVYATSPRRTKAITLLKQNSLILNEYSLNNCKNIEDKFNKQQFESPGESRAIRPKDENENKRLNSVHLNAGDQTLLLACEFNLSKKKENSTNGIKENSSKGLRLYKSKSCSFDSPSENSSNKTPLNHLKRTAFQITPLPDYKSMITPELKKELDKYGIRKLSRRKAIKLLTHIYDQIHPFVSDSESEGASPTKTRKTPKNAKNSKPRDKLKKLGSRYPSQTQNSCGQSSEDAHSSFESINSLIGSDVGSESEVDEEISTTQKGNLETQLRNFIKYDSELYQNILLYEPIWANELHATLKANGIKCSMRALIDFLDQQCVTFRLPTQRYGGKKRKRRSPKKKSA